MAKIANVQLPANQGAQLPVQMAKDTKGTDEFVNLLQLKSETQKQPEKTDAADVKKPVTKEPESSAEKTEEQENLLDQAALEQLAAQLTVVTPTWQEQVPVQTEAAVTEPVLTDIAETVEAPVITPVMTDPAADLQEAAMESMAAFEAELPVETGTTSTQNRPKEVSKAPTEAPKAQETRQTAKEVQAAPREAEPTSKTDTQTQNLASEEPKMTVSESMLRGTGEEQTETSEDGQQMPQAALQNPVSQTERTFQTEKSEGADFKATIEELPEELGKALSSGKTTGTRTLTVELEPASLGKLTIKVSYEAGRTAVSILASNPKSLEILNQKATEIAAILKERTGEETVIYTQETQQQEEDSYDGHQGNAGQEREERSRQGEDKEHETESFAQQLRLGLV